MMISDGAPVDDFCDTVFPALLDPSADDVGYGPTATEEFLAFARRTFEVRRVTSGAAERSGASG